MAKSLPIFHIFAVALNRQAFPSHLIKAVSLSQQKFWVRKLAEEERKREILVNGGTTGDMVGCWNKTLKDYFLHSPQYQSLAPFKWLKSLGSL